MTSSTVCILATIFVYLVGMLVIGFHYAKKNESSTDFYLGGRKLGPLVTAMSAEASDMSSYLLMGLPGLAQSKKWPEMEICTLIISFSRTKS